jgi:hypothetical protein
MDTIHQANRRKIIKILIRSCLIILSFILTVFSIAYFTNSLPDLKTIILVLFFGCIIFPVGLTLLSVLVWSLTENKKKMVFESLELNKIGFVDKEINQGKFWKLNENIKTKIVDNYVVNANFSETHANQLEIEIPLKWRQVDKNEFEILESEFKSQNIELTIGCIVKLFSTKILLATKDYNKLNKDILEFVNLAKQKGFDPE